VYELYGGEEERTEWPRQSIARRTFFTALEVNKCQLRAHFSVPLITGLRFNGGKKGPTSKRWKVTFFKIDRIYRV
jgi:hypothetical protein